MPIRKQPAFIRCLSWLSLNLSPTLTFISIFLLWFSISSPAPLRDLTPVLFTMDSKNADKILADASGVDISAFEGLEKTDAGMWIGVFGSCGRAPSSSLSCTSPSFYPSYNSSFSTVRFLTSDILFNEIYSIPAVPVPVWIVCFILFVISFFTSVIGNLPHYGSEGSNKWSKKWNSAPGVWRFKYWIVSNGKGKWMLLVSLISLCSAMILGLTGSIALFTQWQQVVNGWNFYYGQLLAEELSQGVSANSSEGPLLLAARQNQGAYLMMWFMWTFIGVEILARFYSYHSFPTSIPLYPTPENVSSTAKTSADVLPSPSSFSPMSQPASYLKASLPSTLHSSPSFSSTSKGPVSPKDDSSSSSIASLNLDIEAFDRIVDLRGGKEFEQRKAEVWV